MNRGSLAGTCLSPSPDTRRFNEAPIHESGKSSPSASSTRGTTGFNEAPIHESGKSERRCTESIRRGWLQ